MYRSWSQFCCGGKEGGHPWTAACKRSLCTSAAGEYRKSLPAAEQATLPQFSPLRGEYGSTVAETSKWTYWVCAAHGAAHLTPPHLAPPHPTCSIHLFRVFVLVQVDAAMIFETQVKMTQKMMISADAKAKLADWGNREGQDWSGSLHIAAPKAPRDGERGGKMRKAGSSSEGRAGEGRRKARGRASAARGRGRK